jgi:hypothetical protein
MTARLAILILALPSVMLAQWPSFVARGIPRKPDGNADLSAPAPKTASGRPDLSGVWEVTRPVAAVVSEARTAGPARSNNDLLAAARRSPFWNLGASFRDGLPFTPWAAELHR